MVSEMVKAAREYERTYAQLRKAEARVQAIASQLDAIRDRLATLAARNPLNFALTNEPTP